MHWRHITFNGNLMQFLFCNKKVINFFAFVLSEKRKKNFGNRNKNVYSTANTMKVNSNKLMRNNGH